MTSVRSAYEKSWGHTILNWPNQEVCPEMQLSSLRWPALLRCRTTSNAIHYTIKVTWNQEVIELVKISTFFLYSTPEYGENTTKIWLNYSYIKHCFSVTFIVNKQKNILQNILKTIYYFHSFQNFFRNRLCCEIVLLYINLKNQTSLHTIVLDQELLTLTISGVKSAPDQIGQSLTSN